MSLKQPSPLALRYAGAFIDLAVEAKILDKAEKDLGALDSMLASSEDLQAMVKSASLSAKEQYGALVALASKAKFQTMTTNFLGVVVHNRRLEYLPEILEAFRYELARRSGIVHVRVQVAQDLTLPQTKALEGALKEGLKQDVHIEVAVKPDILGGMIVTVGSHMIDDSVRRKLEKLQIAMGGPSNQNFDIKLKEA